MTLITVEYEELHTGITAAGAVPEWFKRIEAFPVGMYDAPAYRSHAFGKRLELEPARYRNIAFALWELVQ